MSPLELIQATAANDRMAFQQLYALFSEKVYNTALSYTQNPEDAEEITQDVFVNVHRSAAKFKENSSVSTWIYRITINTSLNLLKKRKRNTFFSLGKQEMNRADFVHPGVLLENQENAKALFRVLDTLPDKQKTAFILSFVEDMPRQEVADVMQLSLKAVESLLQRAKKNMREKLKKMYPNRRKS